MGDWSKNVYDKLYDFLTPNGLSGKRVVIGEANPVGFCAIPAFNKEQAETMLYGIPGSQNGFKNSSLFINYGGSVVMRPWQDITQISSACMSFPNTINPPFNPVQ
jgi:hypothetical protein